MKKLFLLSLIGSICYISVGYAQIKIAYALDQPGFVLTSQNPNKFDVLDSSYLRVNYEYHFRAFEKDDSLLDSDNLEVLIGNRYTTCFSKSLRNFDIRNDTLMKKHNRFDIAESSWQGFEIRRNVKEQQLTVSNRIPFSSTVMQYKEPNPFMKWIITSERDSLLGYQCIKATTKYGGRSYIAWFAPDIPVPYGPWKFNGLPGLILVIRDTEKNFCFECCGIKQEKVPIVNYCWKYELTTKEKWKKFERNMYIHAGRYIANTGATVLVMDNSVAGSHPISNSWTAYYNPLEK